MTLKDTLSHGLIERRRLTLLETLAAAPRYVADEVVLRQYLDQRGQPVAVADLRDDLRHLRDRDCIHLDTAAGVWIATLTREGADTAAGLRAVEGVALPPPGA